MNRLILASGSTFADGNGNWTIRPNAALVSGQHVLSVTQQGSGQTPSSGLPYTLTVADVLAAPVITTVAGDNTVSLSEVTGGTATARGTCLSGATVTVTYTNAAGVSVTKTATLTGTNWVAPTLTSADVSKLGGSGSISVTASQRRVGPRKDDDLYCFFAYS